METLVGYLVNITADLNMLNQQFGLEKSFSFEAFKRAWKELSFDRFFTGRRNDIECRDFTEESLKIAFKLCLPPQPIPTKIFGIYLVYALYNCHPFDSKVKVRILLNEWKEITSFVEQIKGHIKTGKDKQFMECLTPGQADELPDVLAVFRQLCKNRAFVSVVTKSALHPSITQMMDSGMDQGKSGYILNRVSVVSKLFDVEAIDMLGAIATEYSLQKDVLCSNMVAEERSLKVTDGNLVQDVTKLVTTHLEWKKLKALRKGQARPQEITDQSGGDSESDASGRASPESSRFSIRERRSRIRLRAAKLQPTIKRFGKTLSPVEDNRDKAPEVSVSENKSKTKKKRKADRRKTKSNADATNNTEVECRVEDTNDIPKSLAPGSVSDGKNVSKKNKNKDGRNPTKTPEKTEQSSKKPAKKRKRDEVVANEKGTNEEPVRDEEDIRNDDSVVVVEEELVREDHTPTVSKKKKKSKSTTINEPVEE